MPFNGSFSTAPAPAAGGAGVPAPVNLDALTGGGTIDEVVVFAAGGDAYDVTTLWIHPLDFVVANNTNYAAFEFFLRDSAGSVLDTVAFGTTLTGTGDLDPSDRYTYAVEWTVPANGSITLGVSSQGSGTFPRAAYGAY